MDRPTSLENSEPSFIISPEADAESSRLLLKLETGIIEHPDVYGALFDIAVTYSGDDKAEDSFKAVHQYLADHATHSDLVPEVRDQWQQFLRRLPGRDSIANDYWFDPVTEDAIRGYQPIQSLLREGADKRTRMDRKEEIRSALKIERIKFFIGRAATLQNAQMEPAQQPEASRGRRLA